MILSSCFLAIYLLLKIRDPRIQRSSNYKLFNKSIRNELKLSASQHMLDPHELKLIEFLSKQATNNEVTVSDLNEVLNLSKLSKENQRQRRHIILKELNLKLFLITGIRETIIRVSSDKDKRVKSYTFVPEVLAPGDLREKVMIKI